MTDEARKVVVDVRDLRVTYGAVEALKGVSLTLWQGSATGVLGANGAGKSSLVTALMGLTATDGGQVLLEGGRDLAGAQTVEITRQGFAVTPEGGGIFRYMSVEDNLRVTPAAMRLPREVEAERIERAYERFPVLYERRAQSAGTLSGGERQMLGIARALTADPRVLLLDEPSLGLAPKMVAFVMTVVAELVAEGIAVLLVEQNARQALKVCDDAVILERGEVRMHRAASELIDDPAIRAAYLGGDSAVGKL